MRRRAATVVACALSAFATACGGGGQPGSSRAPAGSAGSTAPDALIAAKLVNTTDLSVALGVPIPGIEDQGGETQQSGPFTSQALTETPATILTFALDTYDNAPDAQTAFAQLMPPQGSSPAPQTLSGIGDKAMATADGIFVVKSAQVLMVRTRPSKASESMLDQAKSSGVSFDTVLASVDAAMLHDGQNLATVLAKKMTGQALTGTVVYVPTGAVDPCTVPAASLNNGDIHVTSSPTQSDQPPALECIYAFTGKSTGEPGTGQLAVYTLTDKQAAAALPATTVDMVFSQVPQGSSAGGPAGYSTAAAPPFAAEGTTAGEPDYLLKVDLSAPPGAVTMLLFRVEDQVSSYVVDTFHCTTEVANLFDDIMHEANANGQTVFSQLGPAGAAAARAKMVQDILDWCRKEANPQEPAPT